MRAAFVEVVVPAWATWGQRQGVVLPRRRGKGPSGLPLCRWCDNECKPPRKCWCSEECVRDYGRVWSWSAMRDLVIKRDQETCQRCGTTEPERRSDRREYDSPWEVDHIVRVIDGGTDDPANLRLLCYPCHVAAGYEQRASISPQGTFALALPPEQQNNPAEPL
jgi:5-methylcytosine-specific restriction protein A